MLKPFDQLPSTSRLWIYQANRKFSLPERQLIRTQLDALCEEWSAHGVPLHTSYEVMFDQFIILAVDESSAGASGCSIDGSVRTLKAIQQEVGLDFFNRQEIAFLINESIHTYAMSAMSTLFVNGVLNGETMTFNNALTTKNEWENGWKIPVKDSWLARYLPKSVVAKPSH